MSIGTVLSDIHEWIKRIATPRDELSGHAVCPFAKKASYRVYNINTPQQIVDHKQDRDVVIYLINGPITEEELMSSCIELNKQYPSLVFLPDHKDRNTFIKGVQTNNGKHTLILCQSREKLDKARLALLKTDYYKHWDEEYLKEIMRM